MHANYGNASIDMMIRTMHDALDNLHIPSPEDDKYEMIRLLVRP